jgi:hypothetical protein
MVTWDTAALGAAGAVGAAYVSSFLKERYTRYLDARALAAGLLGEMLSFEEAVPAIRQLLETMLARVNSNQKSTLHFYPMDKPKSVFYEANAARLGLLGSSLVSDIVFVYGHIDGFRIVFVQVMEHGAGMSDEVLRLRLSAGLPRN